MPARPNLAENQRQQLAEFGERLRLARLRQRLTAQQVADSAGITRVTLHRAEAGDAAVTLGTYVKVMAAMALDAEVALLARDDKAAHLEQDAQLPARRASPSRAGTVYGACLRSWQCQSSLTFAAALRLFARMPPKPKPSRHP